MVKKENRVDWVQLLTLNSSTMKQKPFVSAFILFTTVVILSTRSFGQCPSDLRKVPFMWVPKEKSVERKLWFRFGKLPSGLFSKLDILNQATYPIRHPLNYVYDTASFNSLIQMMMDDYGQIDGLRIYFATHDVSYEPDGGFIDSRIFPDKQLVVIYAPTDGRNDLGNYYFFGTDKYPHQFKRTIAGTTDELKKRWIDKYQTNEAEAGLQLTLDPMAHENMMGNKLTDTRSISYCFSDFKDFIQSERRYQNNIGSTPMGIDSIEVAFAAYSDAGAERFPNPTWFKNRLHIIFEFKSLGSTFYIDDSKDFQCRLNVGIATSGCATKGGDNGQLCPPYNCPPDNPNPLKPNSKSKIINKQH